jgi:hypothetical protein
LLCSEEQPERASESAIHALEKITERIRRERSFCIAVSDAVPDIFAALAVL